MRTVLFIVLANLATMLIPLVSADEPSPAKPPQDPAIVELLTTLADNFGRRDTKEMAALWTADADFLAADGERIRGRETIEKAFGEMLGAGPRRAVKFHLVEVRRLSPDVAMVDAIVESTPPRSPDRIPSVTITLVKEEGKWLIASAHETIDVIPAPAAHLQELAWLVGQWEGDKSDAGARKNTCDWTANHSFLIRKFTTGGKDGHSLVGTEVIGWDPRNGRVRSWVFESTGGFGENIWLHDGKRWIVQHTGTAADGDHAAATCVVTPVDANTITVQTRDRTINGEREPDGAVITIKRSTAKKPAAMTPSAKAGLPTPSP
jgi:uncharacterized protein (TIGR02246 family)